LCAKLCGVANSIFFNHDHRVIYTLKDSLDRVGVQYARNLLREAPELPRNTDEDQIGAYWAHCMSVAYGAKRITGISVRAQFHEDVPILPAWFTTSDIFSKFITARHASGRDACLETGESMAESNSHASHGEELAAIGLCRRLQSRRSKCHHDPHACDENEAAGCPR